MIQEDYTTEYKVKVMLAYLQGKPIEFMLPERNWALWTSGIEPLWMWNECQYRIAEEPKRIPFDGSDAFGLVGKKFMSIGNDLSFRIALDADKNGIFFRNAFVTYDELSRLYLVYNKISDKFEPCNKVA